jgi:hypothetical protein
MLEWGARNRRRQCVLTYCSDCQNLFEKGLLDPTTSSGAVQQDLSFGSGEISFKALFPIVFHDSERVDARIHFRPNYVIGSEGKSQAF